MSINLGRNHIFFLFGKGNLNFEVFFGEVTNYVQQNI